MDPRLLLPRRKTSSRLLIQAYSGGFFYGTNAAAKFYSYQLYEGLGYRRRISHQFLGLWTPTLGTVLPDDPLLGTVPQSVTYTVTESGGNWRFRDEGYGLAVANSCDFANAILAEVGIAMRFIPGETYPGSGAAKYFLARAKYAPSQQWRIAVLENDITNYSLPLAYPEGLMPPTVYILWSDTNTDLGTLAQFPNVVSDSYAAEDSNPYSVVDSFLAGDDIATLLAGTGFADPRPWAPI